MRDAKPFSWWVQLRLRNPSQYYSLTSQDEMIADTHVRRQGFWHQWGLKLRESLAHLVDCIMRRVVCDASAAFRVYSV